MESTAIQYFPPAAVPTCEARAGYSRHDLGPLWCSVTIGLRSLFDAQHHRRYYCASKAHKAAVVRMYGVSEWHESELREAFGR